jgi:glycogen(starch) synthase
VGALAAAGIDVDVVAPSVTEAPVLEHVRDGVRVVHVRHQDRFSLATNMRAWRTAARRVVEGLEPEIVHGQGLTGGVPACDVAGVPRVVTAHGNVRADTLYAHSGLAGTVRAKLRDRLVRDVMRKSDAILTVHPDWRVNLPAPPRRLVYVPNIVDEEFFLSSSTPEAGTVLYCGGPAAIKGWDVLLAAWPTIRRTVPGARLTAVGFPIPRPERAAAPDDVTYRSILGPAELAAEMARATVVVIPSRYDVAPLVLAEAWAVGVPVVATTAGGLNTLAAEAALQVAPEDPVALAAAIREVFEGGPEVEAAMREGKTRAERFKAGSIAAAHVALYRELIRGG